MPYTLLDAWLAPLLEELPGLDFFDAHTHIGQNDPDGARSSAADLLGSLDPLDARAVVFPMHEPSGYGEANDQIIDAAQASEGRLVPFCRLDPHHDPLSEATRCLDGGARGIKLHPRAERFTLDEPDARSIFAVAHERRVPVLIHAGRGIPALGAHALELAEEFPEARLILAHAAICDLSWLWREIANHPNVFIDTAWWNPVDLLALLALVPPAHVVLGSDAPYGAPSLNAIMVIRCALQLELSLDQVRSIVGGQLERLLAGERPSDLGPPPGTPPPADYVLDRAYGYLLVALGRLIAGAPGDEGVALARLACAVEPDAPQAGPCAAIVRLLDVHEQAVAAVGPEAAARPSRERGLVLAPLLLAVTVTKTPAVGAPVEAAVLAKRAR